MVTDKDIGEWLKAKRNEKHLSTRYVARQLGYSDGMPSLWESGKRSMSVETLFAYCDLVGADLHEFIIMQRNKKTLPKGEREESL